ncbi:MAG TPA: response regulator [Polyangiaceae bacterium]|nr:response regulator [Polyangiaceae bacterium]
MIEEGGVRPEILVVEDDPAHSEAVARVLMASGGFGLRFAASLADAQQAISEKAPSLVLADLNLADGRAFDLLSSPSDHVRLPVLVMTSHGDEQTAVRAMRAGALDYLVKSPEAFAGLAHAVERALREWRLIESRRAAEAALRESEERFRVFFESSPDACKFVTSEGTFIDINRAAEEMFGYRRDEVVGKTVPELGLFHEDSLPVARTMTNECLEGRSCPPTELTVVHRSGRETVVEARTVTVSFRNGLAILTALRDISARKQAEIAQRRLEEQLRQASKMEAVGRLAGGVAHDFNNLLTGIRGFTDILISGVSEGDPAHADLLEIQRATQRAANLTGQLLAFSRKQMVEPVVLDLNHLLSGAMGILERLIGEDVQVVFRPGSKLHAVRIDPSGMEQVLINLAVNARDAMPEGGQLSIETCEVDVDAEMCRSHLDARPGRYLLLSVTDTGVGMSEGVRSRLFEPFFTTKGPGRGTGLGLSIIYGIVQQGGGFVLVDSGLGRGSTFRIYLPAVLEPPAAVGASAEPELAKGNETILLVEDEVLVRTLVSKFLHGQGYRVLSAARGSDAIQLAAEQRNRIDLLLSDVVLPNMNGRQIYERLAQTIPKLKVLFMSGYTENIIAPHGVLEGGFYFVQMPFSLKELASKVREALDAIDAP